MSLLIRQYRQGVLFASIIGVLAFVLSLFIPALNSVLVALLAGILMSNSVKIPNNYTSGISFTSGKLLEISILFLAFSIDYRNISALGWSTFIWLAIVILAVLWISYFLSGKLNCPGSTGWLIGFGTAICGSSAIAALSPTVSKNKEDVGIAMAVVNLLGAMGMIFLPLLIVPLGLSAEESGILLGGALHSVGNVAGAAYGLSDQAGLSAITVKLARVALLSPGLIFYNYLVNRKEVQNWKQHFSLPWYLYGFILITLFTSIFSIPELALNILDSAGKITLTIAMAAIGLRISFRVLLNSGKKGISFGILIFLIQIILLAGLIILQR